MGIINPETGEYLPPEQAGATANMAHPDDLPQHKADPYESVNHRDFSDARNMSRVAQLTMASLAHDRGDPEAAAQWKVAAVGSQQMEDTAAGAQEMHDLLERSTKPVPPHGARIIDPSVDWTPWGQSDEYKALAIQAQEAAAEVADMNQTDPNFFEASTKAQTLFRDVNDLKDELATKAQDTGLWSVQDQLVAEAKDSLASKADKLAHLMKQAP